jgi:putative ABC transport system substrate-binding protein
LVQSLAVRPVASIFATGSSNSVVAAKAATTTIPIVFAVGTDPVKFGLVASLNRPGGNVTGVTYLLNGLAAKRLELLRDLLPTAAVVGFLRNPTNPAAESETKDVQTAAHSLGQSVLLLDASSDSEIDAAFEALIQGRGDALAVAADASFDSRRDQIISLAARHRVPAIFAQRSVVAAGGLMSYGGSMTDGYWVAGLYIARILRGERPADLPVQQSTKVELAINLRTARALGLRVPPTLLAQADEVIE